MASTKAYINLKEKYDRIIVLIDMDCFYCQVEEQLDPNLNGKNLPIAVVQYVENAGIIAVNYKARELGVTRHMREKEAKSICNSLICIKVPSKYNKADISKYRDAGKRVATVFEKFTDQLERASIDEAYLDITENVATRMLEMREKTFSLQPHHLVNTYAVGYDNIGSFVTDVSTSVDSNEEEDDDDETKSYQSSKLRLLIGASIVSDIRRSVKEETGYTCSAGIGHNKVLAKLVCGINKPNKQTLLSIDSIPTLFKTLEISKIKTLGGKIGAEVCDKLNVKFMTDLIKYQEDELQQQFGQRIGNFLYLISRGIDLEKVQRKVVSKSIAVSKNFRGKNEIFNVFKLKFWIKELTKELKERIDKDNEETNRISKQLIVQYTQIINGKDVASSRTVPLNGNPLNSFSIDAIVQEAFNTIERHTNKLLKIDGKNILNNNIKHLGMSAGKMEELNASTNKIQNLFTKYKPSNSEASTSSNKLEENIECQISEEELNDVNDNDDDINPEFNEDVFRGENEVHHEESLLIASSKFHKDSAIKGEKNLQHWINVLFEELNVKIESKSQAENLIPRKIQLLWKQSISDIEKTFCEEISLNSLAEETINAKFFIDIMKKSNTEFMTNESINPISSIEIKASNFNEGNEWKIKINTQLEFDTHNNEEEEGCNDDDSDCENETIQEKDKFVENYEDKENLIAENNLIKKSEDDEYMKEMEEIILKTQPQQNVNDDDEEEDNLNEISMETETKEEVVAGPSYQQTYAEFQESAIIDVLNPLEECLECGKTIRKFDMLTHIDGHIAMKLSIEQREEFRSEQKRKLLSQANSKSSKKASKPKAKLKQNISIEKFAKRIESNEEKDESKVLCHECNTLIDNENFQTHQDHHFAQKLRLQQLRENSRSNSAAKRKLRPLDSQKSKSVKSFFQ